MKALIVFCSALVLVITGCTKEESTTENNGIIGKWKLKEEFWSPGIGGDWAAVETSKQSVIEFHADSSFTFSANFQKADLQLNRFRVVGNEINMSSTLNSNTDKWYVGNLTGKQLELSIYRCFEGCAYRFVAIK